MARRRAFDFAAVVVTASLVAHGSLPEAAPTPGGQRSLAVPGGALVATGQAPDLTFLYTGDVVGYLEPCG